jgi:hypothetical protein
VRERQPFKVLGHLIFEAVGRGLVGFLSLNNLWTIKVLGFLLWVGENIFAVIVGDTLTSYKYCIVSSHGAPCICTIVFFSAK